MRHAPQPTAPAHAPAISFTALLFLTFLVLKLTGVITWSWVWVTAPLWIPASIFFIILLGIAVAVAVTGRMDRKDRRKGGHK